MIKAEEPPMAEIKFCENNFIHGTDRVVEKLRDSFPQVVIHVRNCLANCGDCLQGPFAVIDDEIVQAGSADKLYEAITEILE